MSLKIVAMLSTLMLSDPAPPAAPSTQPHTAAAVLATSQEWSLAELGGDPAYVEWLLLPGYVSVNRDGTVHDRDAIVASARKHAETGRTAAAAQLADYRRSHPYRSEVKLFGDTAVASYYSTDGAGQIGIKSSDVFVYRQGHWHAIYSQHSTLGS